MDVRLSLSFFIRNSARLRLSMVNVDDTDREPTVKALPTIGHGSS